MQTFCGYIAIVGRPNVGKSTLLNRLLGQKISITSRKPQTTRHNILGINTQGDCQYIYVDTPGIHKTEQKAMNKMMNKSASSALRDVDVAVFVIDAGKWTDEDQLVLDKIKKTSIPTIAVVNKIDKQKDKGALLPFMEKLTSLHSFTHILPLSAKTGNNVDQLEALIKPLLPEHPHLFDDDQLTDRPMRFIVAELVREKVFRLCGQELPYSVTVDIEQFKLEKEIYHISALILVEKEGHKRIIIGNKGEKLKAIGSAARLDMEKMLDKKVFLQCWVKVKSGWSDDERVLRNLGYDH